MKGAPKSIFYESVYFVLALRLLWDGNRRRASRFAQMITSPGIAIIYVSRRIFSA